MVVSPSWLCIFGCWQGSLCGCELSKVRELIRLVVNCFFFCFVEFWLDHVSELADHPGQGVEMGLTVEVGFEMGP